MTQHTASLLRDIGFVYTHGRDKSFRPIMIFTPSKLRNWEANTEKFIHEMTNASVIYYNYIIKYCLLPGQFENWIYIIDGSNIGFTDIDGKVLKTTFEALGNLYKTGGRRTFMLNASFSIYMLWSIFKVFLTEGVKLGFTITNQNHHEGIDEMIDPS